MREARQRGLRKAFAHRLIGRLLRQRFAGVHVRGDIAQLRTQNDPTVYCCNHVSIWDACLGPYLTNVLFHQDPFVLTQHRFMTTLFAWAGAFGVNAADPFSVAKTINYSIRLLHTVPHCGLWVAPQGVIYSFSHRPLNLQAGISYIMRRAQQTRIVPVAFHYTFVLNLRPEAFVSFGEPFYVNYNRSRPQEITRTIEERLTKVVDELDHDLSTHQADEFATVLEGSRDLQYWIMRLMRLSPPPLKTWYDFTAPRHSLERQATTPHI